MEIDLKLYFYYYKCITCYTLYASVIAWIIFAKISGFLVIDHIQVHSNILIYSYAVYTLNVKDKWN